MRLGHRAQGFQDVRVHVGRHGPHREVMRGERDIGLPGLATMPFT
jgi:hypothetical protein